MRRDRPLSVLLAAALAAGVVLTAASPASAGDGGDGASGWVDGASDGKSVTGTANDQTDGTEGTEGTTSTGSGGPNCTKSDGTPDYLRYEGLKHTTMEQQRTDIRPEEQRPGVYLHIYCGDERIGFDFFPDEEVEAIDPEILARSVRLTPPNPVILTSPSETEGLVGIDTWFWLEQWDDDEDGATAGTVTVTVYATPSELTIDPGDGTGPLDCASPPAAYTPGADPATGCTHVYESAGQFTATATLTYDVGFTSNLPGVGGLLDPITTVGSVDVTVRQAQAVVNG